MKSKNNICFENGRPPTFFLKRKRPQFFENGRQPQKNNTIKNNLKERQ